MRYEVIPSRIWIGPNGRRVSSHGACPWYSEAERAQWRLETVGWTVRNLSTGQVGIGRVPWKTRAEADAWVQEQSR